MNKILLKETKFSLHPDDEKSAVFVSFMVPEGVKKLLITYSYSPKILEDEERSYELIKENLLRDAGEDASEYTDYSEFMPLKNLVTLYLRSPEGFRGAAHRQAGNQYHEISCGFASPGFLKGEIISGKWTMCFNAHAVVTPLCIVDFKVEGEVL